MRTFAKYLAPLMFAASTISLAQAEDVDTVQAELIADYEQKFNNPYVAAELGLVDEVIEPRETRHKLIRAMEVLRTKREKLPPKKHGNGPQ